MTPLEARAQRAKAHERQRNDARLCALDFLTWGDMQGVHAKRCVHAGTAVPVCSRDYNPGPVPEDERLYEGSALGVLWGLNEAEAWQLAGWNITRRKETP
jgi:hypothetical protein